MLDTEMQKITVEIPKDLLQAAMKFTGQGMTASVREGLKQLAQIQAQRDLLNLRREFKPSISIEEMRSWEDD